MRYLKCFRAVMDSSFSLGISLSWGRSCLNWISRASFGLHSALTARRAALPPVSRTESSSAWHLSFWMDPVSRDWVGKLRSYQDWNKKSFAIYKHFKTSVYYMIQYQRQNLQSPKLPFFLPLNKKDGDFSWIGPDGRFKDCPAEFTTSASLWSFTFTKNHKIPVSSDWQSLLNILCFIQTTPISVFKKINVQKIIGLTDILAPGCRRFVFFFYN